MSLAVKEALDWGGMPDTRGQKTQMFKGQGGTYKTKTAKGHLTSDLCEF